MTTQSASSSAQLPVSNALEESAAMDTTDNVDDANDLMLRRLKDRQRKRAQDSAAETPQPVTKSKASKGCNKRPAEAVSGSVEPAVSRRKERRLTLELFTQCARNSSEPSASSCDSAAQSPAGKQTRRMGLLLNELRELASYFAVYALCTDGHTPLYAGVLTFSIFRIS